MRSITVRDIDGFLHTINLDYLTRVAWGCELTDDVDMLYISEGGESAEIALKAKSADSMAVFEAISNVSSHSKILNYLHGNEED